ncbi:MAG TPA: flagellar basal body rod protein FlgC [Verrucomicrobiae bacterium]|jgi:flagellar basal-body rod protein FlgC|nr:flagellar basal body rod protein FlgC [Verrucomicrobiae bacterium]
MINILPGIDSTSAALNAERIRMDVVSENIANVNTTRGLDGKPYQREQVVFESVLQAQQNSDALGSAPQTVQIARIEKDQRPPIMVYNPSHPDANAQGMVAMPDISIPEEMVDMIAASRAFEANLAVVKDARAMAMETLSIGKH